MHIEHVVRSDGSRLLLADVQIAGSRADEDGQADASTGAAWKFCEGEVLSPGQEPDVLPGDGPPARGALGAVDRVGETIPWIHSRAV